jgi:hypothetical protein
MEENNVVLMQGYGFSDTEYKDYLTSRPKLNNDVARASDMSFFGAMEAVEGEFNKKVYGDKSLNDILRVLS